MRNKHEFKALVNEHVAAQRTAAAISARRRKTTIRSAIAILLGLVIVPMAFLLTDLPLGDEKSPSRTTIPQNGVMENAPEITNPVQTTLLGDQEVAPTPPITDQTPNEPLPPPYSDDLPNQDSPVLDSITDPVKGISAVNRLVGMKPAVIDQRTVDEAFRTAYLEFAMKLFQGSDQIKKENNLCFSPLSAMLALSMAANGADGQTLAEMETLLCGDLSVDELNATLRTWTEQMMHQRFSESILNASNSIWVRKDQFLVNPDFLQTNANYYQTAFYEAPFDDSTVEDINLWIRHHTGGMIDKMIDEIDEMTMMYLINTLYLETLWDDPYGDLQLSDGLFHGTNGDALATMMSSTEFDYLSMAGAEGFSKSMDGYNFVAILPDEGMDIGEFVASLTAEELQAFLQSKQRAEVHAKLPAFSYDSSISLTDVLKPYIPTAMNESSIPADFSHMGQTVDGNTLYISSIRQNTSITLNKDGVCAAAGTVIELPGYGMPPDALPVYHITLDRPFVYVITDEVSNLPIFMGVVEQL